MGNCLGTRKNNQGQRLGSADGNAQRPNAPLGGGGGNALGSSASSPSAGGGSGSGPGSDREAMLAAAEQRRLKAENRGVVKQDGKLSKQLADQKRQNPLQADSNKDMPERIVWD
ncbi:hypothetical protein BDB00DRAFT_808601 [Zychaea mexicana]|uniref:uncharacterized protein n=1 Tax=Zychaea mexicana TaxID=64656 RepID=UPI0022FEDA0E|nr:uncharacterized protein BDB00DRAFT_808601 [Zychaea mexicana]KAI9496375.1 hypothetical protein BDB00DRAFT_808601 [Zychaea mexicana]